MKGLYFNKTASFPHATFSKLNTVTAVFQGFYRDFWQFFVAFNISTRHLTMADYVTFKKLFINSTIIYFVQTKQNNKRWKRDILQRAHLT